MGTIHIQEGTCKDAQSNLNSHYSSELPQHDFQIEQSKFARNYEDIGDEINTHEPSTKGPLNDERSVAVHASEDDRSV